MKRPLILLLLLSFCFTVADAGDNVKPLTKARDKAVLFQLSGLGTLGMGNYEGGLGFQYYIAKDFALRVAVGFSMDSRTDKNPATGTLPQGVLGESKYSGTSFSITPGVRINLAQNNAVVAYTGGLFSFRMTSQERIGNSSSFEPGFQEDAKYSESELRWGVAAMFGVEWFPWDNISFSGEYRFGFASSSGDAEASYPPPTPSVTRDEPTFTGLSLGSANSAALTLSVFF